ncbi:MAG: hypothetical protein ACUZ8O_15010 [Candidatus Anammoxibacter sp.]
MTTKTLFAGIFDETHLTVSYKRDSFPCIFRACFGFFSRLQGQNHVPEPPAIITAKSNANLLFEI